nr:calcium/sodium antiporter [Shimia ponticola]
MISDVILDWTFVVLGLVILLLAGDVLVKGAVNLALRLGIPALIVSLTIVAFGTSAPELLIAISAVDDGAPGLALGNVVGSNTANILLVLGIPAMLATLDTSNCDTRKSYLYMIAATVLFIALAFTGEFQFWHGCVLLIALAFILLDQARDAHAHRNTCSGPSEDEEDLEGADPNMPWWKISVFLILGIAGLPLGADLLVDGATAIARDFGMSEVAIGLTLVAIGTSLPELATTVVAAYRKQADVALGNVIGSNMFNLLAIIGITSLIGDIEVDKEFLQLDLWVMLGASLLLAPFVFRRWKITRVWGVALSVLYAIYLMVVLA